MTMANIMLNKINPIQLQQLIRQEKIAQRLQLSLAYQDINLKLILAKLRQLCFENIRLENINNNLKYKHIAFYYPLNNEVDTRKLWKEAQNLGIKTYLPIIDSKNKLRFRYFDQDTQFTNGKYNIQIPVSDLHINAQDLDLVITPLVACDKHGNRIGMGGGYYDKSFSFIKIARQGSVKLIGVGWDFQLLQDQYIPANAWDVKLTAFISQYFDIYFD